MGNVFASVVLLGVSLALLVLGVVLLVHGFAEVVRDKRRKKSGGEESRPAA